VDSLTHLSLCANFPLFEKIGEEKFSSKLWILLILLKNKNGLEDDHFGSIMCSTLHDECHNFSDIVTLLRELHTAGLINRKCSTSSKRGASLTGDTGFALNEFIDETSKKCTTKNPEVLRKLFLDCDTSFGNHTKFHSIISVSSFNLKEKFFDILEISAKGCLNACFKIALEWTKNPNSPNS